MTKVDKRNKTRLRELCTDVVDCPHSTPVWTDAGMVVLRNQNIRNGRLDLSSPSFTDDEHYRQRIRRAEPRAGDLVITREAPMGEVCEIPEGLRCCLGQRMVLLRPDKKKCNGRFLLYALQSPEVRHEIFVNEGTGSTVSNLRIPLLENLGIPSVPREEQDAIACILGALDDKIELNRRMSRTLEAMARAIFKSWFVDFDPVRAKAAVRREHPKWTDAQVSRAACPNLKPDIADLFPDSFEDSERGEIPKGWRVGTLGEIGSEIRDGLHPRSIPSETPYIALEHLPRRSIVLDDWDTADSVASGKMRFRTGDILFGKLRPYFHKVGPAPVDGVCSTDVVVSRPKDEDWYGILLGHETSDAFVAYTDRTSGGTKMPRTNWVDMAAFSIVLPQRDAARAFSQHVRVIVEKTRVLIHESRLICKIRDHILPALVSGSLRLNEVERIASRLG